MAFSTKLLVYETDSETPTHDIWLRWWSEKELQDKYPFVETTDGTYRDFFLDVTKEQLAAIIKEQSVHIRSAIYSNYDWKIQLDPVVKQIEAICTDQIPYKRITINIYEWESGLG